MLHKYVTLLFGPSDAFRARHALSHAVLVGSNLRGANLGRDNLEGATSLQGANFSDAVLNGANLGQVSRTDRVNKN
jgi:uncharacterized protein YjbI with pentapeptide repeats